MADKGFPLSQIRNELMERPDLHFLTAIKRNDKRIADNSMLSFDGVLNGVGEQMLYKKCRIKGGCYLYSFMAESKASSEAAGYIDRRRKNKDSSAEEYSEKLNLFGVIVFESDLDLDPTTVYRCYDERWILELVFDRYKNDDGYWVHTLKEHLAELEALGLSKPVPKPAPRKRRRPKKVQDQETNKPKRPEGRARRSS